MQFKTTLSGNPLLRFPCTHLTFLVLLNYWKVLQNDGKIVKIMKVTINIYSLQLKMLHPFYVNKQ